MLHSGITSEVDEYVAQLFYRIDGRKVDKFALVPKYCTREALPNPSMLRAGERHNGRTAPHDFGRACRDDRCRLSAATHACETQA